MKAIEMNDMELDNISGGTCGELNELLDAIDSRAGAVGIMEKSVRTAGDRCFSFGITQFANIATRNAAAPICEKILKDSFGIDSYISIGWGGTGIRSVNNSYSKNGKSLSHAEVLKIIQG